MFRFPVAKKKRHKLKEVLTVAAMQVAVTMLLKTEGCIPGG